MERVSLFTLAQGCPNLPILQFFLCLYRNSASSVFPTSKQHQNIVQLCTSIYVGEQSWWRISWQTPQCLGRSIFDQLFYTNIHDFYNLEQEICNSLFYFFHIPFVLFHMWVFRLKASYLLLWSSTHKRLRRKLNNLNFTTNVWKKFHLNWFCNLLKYHSTGSAPHMIYISGLYSPF